MFCRYALGRQRAASVFLSANTLRALNNTAVNTTRLMAPERDNTSIVGELPSRSRIAQAARPLAYSTTRVRRRTCRLRVRRKENLN